MSECTCDKCIQACENTPGWFTPQEAEQALNAGLAKRLMLDWWAADENIYVLSPASEGLGGGRAPELTFFNLFTTGWGQCVFLKDSRCEIHSSGFKPKLCRETLCCTETYPSKEVVVEDWASDYGKSLIERWKKEVNYVE